MNDKRETLAKLHIITLGSVLINILSGGKKIYHDDFAYKVFLLPLLLRFFYLFPSLSPLLLHRNLLSIT